MQLVKSSFNLKPITLAAVSLFSASSIAYSDIDAFSGFLTVATNCTTLKYIESIETDNNSLFLQKLRFQNYLTNWQEKTMFSSSTKAIVEDEDFQAIVSMGLTAVPYIIENIETNPSTLVWALNLIFNRRITNDPNATISDACKLWVKELKR